MLSYYQERCPQETSWLLPETCKYKLLLGNMTTIIPLRPLWPIPYTGNTKKQNKNSTADYKKQQQNFWTTPSWPFHWDTIICSNKNNNILKHIAVFQLLATQKTAEYNNNNNNNNSTITITQQQQHSESCLLPTSGTQSLARPLRLVPITNTRSAVLAQAFAYII